MRLYHYFPKVLGLENFGVVHERVDCFLVGIFLSELLGSAMCYHIEAWFEISLMIRKVCSAVCISRYRVLFLEILRFEQKLHR